MKAAKHIHSTFTQLTHRWTGLSEKVLFTPVPRGDSYLRRVIWWLPVFAFTLLLTGNLSLWHYTAQLDQNLAVNQSRNLTEQVTLRVENLLDERLNDLALLATEWISEEDPQKRAEQFMVEATWLAQREPSYHVINYIDAQSVIRLSAPEGKRPELVNLDLKTLPGRQQLHQQVRDSGLPLASTPITLTTNKPGIALWFPIIDEQETAPVFAGIIAGTVHIDMLVERAITASDPEDFRIQIAVDDNIIYQTDDISCSTLQQEALKMATTTELLGRVWRVSACLKEGSPLTQIARTNRLRFGANLLLALLVSALLALALYAVDRTRANQQRVQESEQRYRLLAENVHDVIWTLDNNLRFTYVSPSEERMTGFTPAETRDRPLEKVLLASSYASAMQTFQEEMAAAQNGQRRSRKLELEQWRKDGSSMWIEISATFLYDTNNRPVGILGVSRDITERKQAEAERAQLMQTIQAQARRVQQIIDTVPEGVLLIDADGKVAVVNPVARKYVEMLGGVQPGDVLTHWGNRPLDELLTSPPKGLWHEVEMASSVYQVIARPLEDTAELEGWVLVTRDVTQQREIETTNQRQAQLAAVGQLAAGIAHDFNNIMAAIVLYAQMTARDPQLPPRVRERMQVIDQQAGHAAKLIQQILDFSRRAVLERQPLDLLPFLKEHVKLLQRTLPEHIEVRFICDEMAYVVNADPTRIQQMLTNLAVNARDAMPQGGNLDIRLEHITISTAEAAPLPGILPGEWVRLAVSDSGMGIPPDILPHIFEPFFTTKAPLGTGLGLSQVYGIVEAHNGHIGVTSTAGQGTTFAVYLPLHTPDVAIAPPVKAPTELHYGDGQTLLLVEDDRSVRSAIADSLATLNYRVLEAENGQEALVLLQNHRDQIALVVSDVVMPKMGGMALHHALRQQGLMIPIILLTGHPLDKDLNDLQTQGPSEWLLKPPDLENLAQTIARMLG